MEINWEQFNEIIAGILDSADETLQLLNNGKQSPCLYKAIKLIDETFFITNRFSVLLNRYPANGSSQSELPYHQSFAQLRNIMHKLVKMNSCHIEDIDLEAPCTDPVELQCQRLLDASISPYNSTFVKEFEDNTSIAADATVKAEATLTLRKILSWSDGQYFQRLNAYGLLNDTNVRHPLEKFLMSLIGEVEMLDPDFNAIKTHDVHRFNNLTSFIYHFSERSYGVLRGPLQDTLTVSETILQYAALVLSAANKVGFPKEMSVKIEGKISKIRGWFEENSCFSAVHQVSIKHVAEEDLESPNLDASYISNIPAIMQDFINLISGLLIGCYPYFSKEQVSDRNERQLRIRQYEIYRENYFDVVTQLKSMIIKLKAQLGNSGSGLIKQYSHIKAEQEKLAQAAEARKVVIQAMALQREKLSTSGQQQGSPLVRPPTPNSGEVAKRKSGANAGLGNSVGSKSGMLPRRSPLSTSSGAAIPIDEKPRSRSSGDDQSPRASNNLLNSPKKETPAAAEEGKKSSFLGALFGGRKKADAQDKRRGSASEASLKIQPAGPEDLNSPRSKSAHTTPREGEEGSKDCLDATQSSHIVRKPSDAVVM